MATFSIAPIPRSSCRAILADGVRAAVIYPDEGDAVQVYPWPRTYRDLVFTGLPEPLKPGWERFDSVEAVADRLGIPAGAREALAA